MRALGCALAGALSVFVAGSAQANPVSDLQHLLDNAGYNTGGQTGQWSKGTAAALVGFATQYGLDTGDTSAAPDDAAVVALIAAANAKLDAAHAAYPTEPLPPDYFVGLGDANWFVIHNWSDKAITKRDGKMATVPVTRFNDTIDDDISRFKAAGINVIRAQLGMDGALFFSECNYRGDADMGVLDECYVKAYAEAAKNKWAKQIDLLGHFADNPVVKLYADAVAKWNRQGFHVIFVPTDFFNGNGSHFNGTDNPNADSTPLFHRALMRDAVFQDFFPKFAAAVLDELKQRGATNVSLQSANEPRFCGKNGQPGSGDVAKWQALERAEFDAARRVAPHLSFISTAVCTASVSYFDGGRPYTELGKVMPFHKGLDDVTYAFHLYSPSALFGGSASNNLYKPGTVIHYPYQAIAANAGANEGGSYSVKTYNKTKPGAKFFDKVFADVGTFAEQRAVRVIITETGIPRSDFSIPREDRIALLRDLIASTKKNGVAFSYFAMFGEWGLSSCSQARYGMPDHRFDSGLLAAFAWGNGVAGADPGATGSPLEADCGPTVNIHTSSRDNQPSGAASFDTAFDSLVADGKPDEDVLHFGMRGRNPDAGLKFLEFLIRVPLAQKDIDVLTKNCPGQRFAHDSDGQYALMPVKIDGKALTTPARPCIVANAPKAVAFQARFLGTRFADIARDMVTATDVDAIANPALKSLISAIAAGEYQFADATRP